MNTYPTFYHAHHLLRSEDLLFWLSLAEQFGGPILELGCGTGRLTIPLARAGHTIVGLDNDPSMLEYLKGNCSPELYSNMTVLLGDMTSFDLGSRYGLIILPCNTFSTFSKKVRRLIYQSVRNHLLPGGIFAFSVPNPVLLADLPSGSDMELEEDFNHPNTGYPVQVFSGWERGSNTVQFTWQYQHLFPDGQMFNLNASTTHFLDPVDSYLEEIRSSKFTLLEVFGNYDHSQYTADSTYLIVVASRDGEKGEHGSG